MTEELEYSVWLREFAAQSERAFVRESEAMVKYLIQLDEKLPPEYGWRVIAVGDFREQAEKTAGGLVT